MHAIFGYPTYLCLVLGNKSFAVICFSSADAKVTCESLICRLGCQYGYQRDSNGCMVCKCEDNPCMVIARHQMLPLNSLAPGRSLCDFQNVIFNLALLIGIFKSFYDNVLRWMPQDLTDDKSKLIQVMAWYRQATSHYLNQCWPRSPT